MTAPGSAASTASAIVGHGLSALPSPAVVDASTNCVVASVGMSPQGPSAHGPTGRHAVSPGTAMLPGSHRVAGAITRQPWSPSGSKPDPQRSGGTPACTQLAAPPSLPQDPPDELAA